MSAPDKQPKDETPPHGPPGLLQDVVIVEYSLTPQGANPPAFVAMAKEDDMKDCPKCGEKCKAGEMCKCGAMVKGEMCKGCKKPLSKEDDMDSGMCKSCGSKKHMKKSLWALTVDVLKELTRGPKSTKDNLAALEFAGVRKAFEKSVQDIVGSDVADKPARIAASAEEFFEGLEKAFPEPSDEQVAKFEQLDVALAGAMRKELKDIPGAVSAALDTFQKEDKEAPMATKDETVDVSKELVAKDAEIAALKAALAKEEDAKLEKEVTAEIKALALPGVADEAQLVKDLVDLRKAKSPLVDTVNRIFAAAKAMTTKSAEVLTQATGAGGTGPASGGDEHSAKVTAAMQKELAADPKLSPQLAYAKAMARPENAELYKRELQGAGYQGVKASAVAEDEKA